jgi:hypothetical protein
MNTTRSIIKKITRIKAVIILLMAASIVSYATMGITSAGKNNIENPKRSLLSQKSSLKPGTFSLKSGYQFRGGQLFSTSVPKYINLNTVATYQIGKTVYTVPLKKQFLVGGKVSVGIQNQIIR